MSPILQVCQNGDRGAADHSAAPITPEALAADLAACLAAGADEAHLHPRDGSGAESLDAAHIEAAMKALRPLGAPLGVSTQEGIRVDDGAPAAVASWGEKPDYASVNLHEAHAPAVRRALDAAGIGCEAGVWTVDDVARLAEGPAPLRILIEIMEEDPAKALAEADDVLSALDRTDASTPRLLHGQGGSAWPLLRRAQALGLSCRIGFEDVLVGEDGAPVPNNAALVAAAAGGEGGSP
ncbi:MAG: 3-keto-5-aminohexanoate cleavage protein [Pseudomonadota bacterium]